MALRVQCILVGLFLLSILSLATADTDMDEKAAELDTFDGSELEIFNVKQRRDLDQSDMGQLEELILEERWFITRPPRIWCWWIAIPLPFWDRGWFFGFRWLILRWCWRHFWIWGDPQYATVDGREYKFHGTCVYVMATTIDPTTPQFTVYSENHYPTATQQANRVSSPKNVMVEVYGYLIQIGQGQRVVVNGVERTLPLLLGTAPDYVAVFQQPDDIAIYTNFGLLVTFNGRRRISINFPDEFKDKIRGLVGNFDDDPENDFMKPDGTLAADEVEFGNSWKDATLSDATCVDDQGNSDSVCSPAEQVVVDAQCGGLNDPSGVFAPCHALVPADRAQISCEFDMCSDFGNLEFLCNTYELYATLCEHFDLTIQWRSASFCPMDCGDHAHYVDSVTPCVSSCQNPEGDVDCVPPPDDPSDSIFTSSGCVCDTGYMRDGKDCILVSQCGCVDPSNIYHKIGEVWSDCYTKCTCVSTNTSQCVSVVSCPPGWSCVTQPDNTEMCVCDTPTCQKTCAVSQGAVLRNHFLFGAQLADESKHEVAYTDGPAANKACRIQIQVRVTAGVVDFAGINIGVWPGKPNKYYRNYVFDLWSNNGAFMRGFQVKGLQQIFFPPNPHSFSTSDFSATVSELSATTWQLDVTCGTDHMLTLKYGVPGDGYVEMVVDSPEQWSEPCYPDV